MRRKRSVAGAVWLLAAVTLAALAWFWWQANNPPRHPIRTVQLPSASKSTRPQPVVVLENPSTSHPGRPANTGPTLETSPPPTTNRPTTQPGLAVTNNITAPSMANLPSTTLPYSTNYPRGVQNTLEMQVALACQRISPGCLDGLIGPQTRSALRSYQQREHLPITGELDKATRERLVLEVAPLVTYAVTSNDVVRLQPLSPTWLGKSQQTALEYETLLELVSEKAQSTPALIRRLNRHVDWTNAPPGTLLELPNVSPPTPGTRAAYINIRLSDKILEAWDENTNLLAHFPCSIARRVEKRPVGELHVAVIAPNPDYTFDPEIFPESAEARELKTKLVLPPGPNNPVGVAWIGLDKPGYGIHGTPNPEQVGHTESHGCFRLANWNAELLLRLVSIGTPVYVQP